MGKSHLFVIEKDLQISKQKRWIYSTCVVFVSTMEGCLIDIIYEVIFTIILSLTFLPTFMHFRVKQQSQGVLSKKWRRNSKYFISYSIFWVTSFFRSNEHQIKIGAFQKVRLSQNAIFWSFFPLMLFTKKTTIHGVIATKYFLCETWLSSQTMPCQRRWKITD